MEHAWCSDPSRDAVVRAAEDGRDRPLPTLGEAIVLAFGFDKASAQRACDEVKSWPEDVQKDCRFVLGDLLEQGVERLQALVEAWRYGKGLIGARYPEMIPKSGSASSALEQENKGEGIAARSESQTRRGWGVSDRRTTDATLIEAVRILSRTIKTADGVIPACLAEVATRLAELVEERRWVPVGERLPTVQGDDVLTARGPWEDGGYSISRGWWNGECWMSYASDRDIPPVAFWMPLPPGPEGDGNG
jgi:hypothetical protein